jgi:hypothetical protein
VWVSGCGDDFGSLELTYVGVCILFGLLVAELGGGRL